ncbi:MAG: hypothetical protein HKM94_07550 [Halobacteria archaeon]|nr:hypothetical protein [Halobacteria archaeon]
MSHNVMTCAELPEMALQQLLAPYDLEVIEISDAETLPGSFWGDPEAGLIANRLYLRPSTPVQSALHEACHYICMDSGRRHQLHTDAGGDYDEENGVCYLQILLADRLAGMTSDRMMQDMDTWGYSFRLGSTRAWFERDAKDAKDWLIQHQLLDQSGQVSWQLRTE